VAATGDLLEQFRIEMNDAEEPFLWSDELVYKYLNDAQKQFARKTDGIQDSTTVAVCTLAVIANTNTYALHPTIKKIRSVRRADNGRPVEVINEEDMPGRKWFFDGRTGVITALITGMDENSVRVWPVPFETVNLQMSVFRLPLVEVVDDQALEIGAQHHMHLLSWAKHLAYLKQDADAFDRTKADEFGMRFERYCADVQAEQRRLRHKQRSVVYGGI